MGTNAQNLGDDGNIPVYFESTRKMLICQIHGFVIPPTSQGISRHLRGEGHNCRGWQLKRALTAFASLALSSMDEILSTQPTIATQPVAPPMQHLKILQGWNCLPCRGRYLTASFELLERHLVAEHGVKRKSAPMWESCHLQTFFRETKRRRYFRVSSASMLQINYNRDNQDQLSCSGSLHPSYAPLELAGSLSKTTCFNERLSVLAPSLRLYHPFACQAKEHVQWLPLSYLDQLFQSVAFGLASEPLFNPSHVDAEFGMQTVSPLCQEDPVFYHALLYSMVSLSRHEKIRIQAAALKTATISLINSRLSSTQPRGSGPLIGAIMVLRGTAYKLGDSAVHDIHARGLEGILGYYGHPELTVAARKAEFWQYIYAAIFLDRICEAKPADVFGKTDWLRCTPLGQSEPCQAAGFIRHQDVIPAVFLGCVADTLELQSIVSMLATSRLHEKYQTLDSMQASIESRLMSCRQSNPVAEAVRLGIFMCCYCSWVEIWDDKYIPCILATKLFDKIETTMSSVGDFHLIWGSRLDLWLWLLFVGSCAVGFGRNYIEDLPQRQQRLLSQTRLAMEVYTTIETRYAMHRALQDYLYCQDWLAKRSYVQEWNSLETWIRNLEM